MGKGRITKREKEKDAAEKWLSENDPDYAEQKKKWQTPSTDVLARDKKAHPTLKDMVPLNPRNHGNYRKKTLDDEPGEPFNYSDVDKDLEF